MKWLTCCLLMFWSCCCYSQQNDTKKAKREIQYLGLKDTVLLKNLRLLVGKMDSGNVKNNYKKEFGYIQLYITNFSKGDTVISYYMTPQYIPLDKKSDDSKFPDFYSFMDKKLIVINFSALNVIAEKVYSNKSKRSLLALMDKYFEKPHKVIFHNMDGTVSFIDKHFRQSWYPIGAGEYIYILKRKPAIVQNDRF